MCVWEQGGGGYPSLMPQKGANSELSAHNWANLELGLLPLSGCDACVIFLSLIYMYIRTQKHIHTITHTHTHTNTDTTAQSHTHTHFLLVAAGFREGTVAMEKKKKS